MKDEVKKEVIYYDCYNCSKRTRNVRGLAYNDNGEERRYCKQCFDDYCYECNDCNDYFDYDLNGVSDYSVCNNCFENYSQCHSCEEYFSETQYCDSCDNSYCYSCGNDSESHDCGNDDKARSVTLTKPTEKNKKGKFLKIDRLVGCELEAENGDRSQLFNNLDKTCGIEDDGSLCGSGSAEVQTSPRSMLQAEKLIEDTCEVMTEAGFDTQDECAGLHVHIDFSDHRHDFKMIARLFRTMYAIEDIIYASLRKNRTNNTYCVPLKNGYAFSDVKVKMVKDEMLRKYYKDSNVIIIKSSFNNKYPTIQNIRYNGLNLHSIMYRGTVEFRHHEGSLDSKEIIQWVSLLSQIVDYAVNHYSIKEVVRILKAKDKATKFKRMCKFMKLKKETKDYLKERIAKNNPDFFKPIAISQPSINQYNLPINERIGY